MKANLKRNVGRGCGSVVAHLLSMYKTPRSNPGTPKEAIKERNKQLPSNQESIFLSKQAHPQVTTS